MPEFHSKMWSGYIVVDEENEGKLFYWLVESEKNPDTAPLMIWLNGGPGCSSMDGFFLENGPFHVNSDKETLLTNEYSWHKVANMLYVGIFSFNNKE